MLILGQKHSPNGNFFGHKFSTGSYLGHKSMQSSKNYIQNIKAEQPHRSPIEKIARSPNALGQYA